jgi:long-chain fatty acid transport protein
MEALCVLHLCLGSSLAHADMYHDNNIIPGTRAAGLGGAFTALGNDASGIVYNPAGLGFAESTNVSASVNAYNEKRTVHAKVLGGNDFKENSSGVVAPFFGGLKRAKDLGPFRGLAAGFAVAVPDTESQDQNDLVQNRPDIHVIRYHRTQNMRGENMLALAGGAVNFGDLVGIGVGGGYRRVEERIQSYQDSKLGVYVASEGDGSGLPTGSRFISNISQNIRYHRRVESLEAIAGLRVVFGNSGFSLGASYVRTFLWAQLFDQSSEYLNFYTDEAGGMLARRVSSSAAATSAEEATSSKQSFYYTDAIEFLPDRFRLGMAWSNPAIGTLTFDGTYTGALVASLNQLERKAIWNLHAGVELTLLAPLVARYGAFTNNDAAPGKGADRVTGRGEYVNYIGQSASIGIHPSGVEYMLSATLQEGVGEAEKIPGRTNSVTSRLFTVAFSVSHETK